MNHMFGTRRSSYDNVTATNKNPSSSSSSSALPPLRGATNALNLNNTNTTNGGRTTNHSAPSSFSSTAHNNHQQQQQSALGNAMNQHSGNNNNNNSNNDQISSSSSSTRHQEADTITNLRSKMEKQRVELDLRTDNVNAIQRNFQRLSEMYHADRQRLQELEKNAKAMQIEIESLRAEQKLFRALQQEYNGLKNQLQQQEDIFARSHRGKETEIANLKLEVQNAQDRERAMRETLMKLQGSTEKDSSLRDRLAVAVTGCERALAETVTQIVDSEQFLRAEVEQSLSPSRRNQEKNNKNDSSASSSSGPDQSFTDLLLLMKSSSSNTNTPRQTSSTSSSSPGSQARDDLDSRVKSHSSNIKHFSTILGQKLSSITRMVGNTKKDRLLEVQELNSKISELQLECQRLKEDVRRAEDTSSMARSIANESNKQFSNDRAQLKQQLLDTYKSLLESKQECLVLTENGQRFESIVASCSKEMESNLLLPFFQERHEISEKEWTAKIHQLEVAHAKNISEKEKTISELESQLKDSMGDHQSIANRFEKKLSDAKNEINEIKQKFETMRTFAQEQVKQLHASQRQSMMNDQTSQRNQIEINYQTSFQDSFVFPDRATLVKFFQQKTSSLKTDLDSELKKSKTLLSRYHNLESQLLEHQNKGSQQETELSQQLRDKNRELSSLAGEKSTLSARLEAQQSKVSALEESVQTMTEQVRLSKEAETRALSLHAQSVALADSAKSDARRFDQERKRLEEELNGTKERAGLFERKLEKAENDLWAAQKERDQAVKDRKIEAEKITENETQLAQLRDWASQLRQLHSQSITTVKKILAAEEACESGYSCQSCLELMKEPLVLAPCGHSFCRSCYNEANSRRKPPTDRAGDSRSYCPECRAHSVTCAVPSSSLDLLSGKFAFRCNALKELQTVLEKSSAFQM